ncbi:MAG: amidohydrolase family protein [Alphaproteobacteria bacterium]|nr:amidohydrolase family protein [Alphaproteobacteria bacterium]
MAQEAPALGNVIAPDPKWAAQTKETALEPGLPIVDPHHHLWQRAGNDYLFHDLLADTQEGHNVVATVFVDCHSMYRKDGPAELRCIGETEFANGVAAMSASGIYGDLRACAGIVSHVDLRLGAKAGAVFDAQIAAGNSRFKGIRYQTGWDADPGIRNSRTDPTPELTRDPTWREGFKELAKRKLTFDAWLYHPQLAEIAELADAFPDTPIVLDHVGGPLGYAGYAGRHDGVRAAWKKSMAELARRQNVVVKVGGLGMAMGWFDFYQRPKPPGSEALARAFKPWVETTIELFGADRCMFESNFPVDKITSGYGVLWNAFKRLAAGCSPAEKTALFSGTAARVYSLTL